MVVRTLKYIPKHLMELKNTSAWLGFLSSETVVKTYRRDAAGVVRASENGIRCKSS